jgi:hypothetical protein
MEYMQRLKGMRKEEETQENYITLPDVLRKMCHAISHRTVLCSVLWRIRDEMPYGTGYVS